MSEDFPTHDMKYAFFRVLNERRRQVEWHGWTEDHDDKYHAGELSRAATCYAMIDSADLDWFERDVFPYWPWSQEWWKPGDELDNLTKAAALIIAEIERVCRERRRMVDHEPTP